MRLAKRPRLWPGLNCLACLCPPLPTGLQYAGNCCPVGGRAGPKGCQHSGENDIKHCISSTPKSYPPLKKNQKQHVFAPGLLGFPRVLNPHPKPQPSNSNLEAHGLGFRVRGSGFRVQGLGCVGFKSLFHYTATYHRTLVSPSLLTKAPIMSESTRQAWSLFAFCLPLKN